MLVCYLATLAASTSFGSRNLKASNFPSLSNVSLSAELMRLASSPGRAYWGEPVSQSCKRDFWWSVSGRSTSQPDASARRDLDPYLSSGGIVACSVAGNNAKLILTT